MRERLLLTAASACGLSAFGCGAVAHAADLELQVLTGAGAPVADAVVSIHLIGQPTPRPTAAGRYVIDQQDIQFHPFVTAIPVGANVTFLNHDLLRHHVYSFSPARKFELKLASRQQNQSVLFDKAGIVPLGCNIHDRMIAYIAVVDTPWARTSDARGRVELRGIPAGRVTVTLWHPYLRAPGNTMSRTVTIADGPARQERLIVALRSPPRDPGTSY